MTKSITKIRARHLPLLVLLLVSGQSYAAEVIVAAANSTCEALQRAAVVYQRQYGISVNTICKSSGLLEKGIQGKAIRADVFISASKEWMDKAVAAQVVVAAAVRPLWGNSLVVVIPKAEPLELADWSELAADKVKVILIGDPGSAPFGRYAKQALESTGLWESVRPKIQTRKNITLLAEAVAAAEQGTVGIIFRTNVTGEMRVLQVVDEVRHEPVRYYASVVSGADNIEEANSFLRFLQQAEARKIFADVGFAVLEE